MRFSDIGYAIAAGQVFAIGSTVEISGQNTVIFDGEVTGVEMTLEHGQPEFTVVADDPAYKLTLGTKVRTFTQVSYSEVIAQIAGEHGLQHTVTGLTTPRHDYLLQADSDFGFLNEIADRSGSDWWIDDRIIDRQTVWVSNPLRSFSRSTTTCVRSRCGPVPCIPARQPSRVGGRKQSSR